MSAQTGSLPPPGPASRRFADRARFRLRLWESQPNPLWIRDLRQSARLSRTPVILTVVAVLMTLFIASLGGIVSTEQSPASTGMVIFQVFFSLAYFVVALMGPAVAANSIASEREGRTWEAVILTGLSPATIARGKFLAAFTAIAMYIVMLAPVGALPFLFGGVTATEVAIAFGGLLVAALLGVAFGLAISSKMSSLRAAIVVTLLLAFPLSIAAFLTFGVSLSIPAHRAWPGVAEGPPIWLPSAYERAPFGVDYVIFLVVLPALAVVIPAWFLYEVTVANLTSDSDDRSSGLKRWFLCAAPALTVAAAVPMATVSASDRAAAAIAGLTALGAFFLFCVFLFLGDPIGPSRRVRLHWERARRGALPRFLGPGVMRSALLVLVVGAGGLAALALLGASAAARASGTLSDSVVMVTLYSGYLIAFFVFVVGLGAFLRARTSAPLVARLLLAAVLFGVSVGPWVVAAVAGVLRDHGLAREVLVVASPSPLYVFVMMQAVTRGNELQLQAGLVAMTGWAAFGVVLLAAASRRCVATLRRRDAMLAEGDRILAAEDEAAAARTAVPEDAVPVADAPADETAPAT